VKGTDDRGHPAGSRRIEKKLAPLALKLEAVAIKQRSRLFKLCYREAGGIQSTTPLSRKIRNTAGAVGLEKFNNAGANLAYSALRTEQLNRVVSDELRAENRSCRALRLGAITDDYLYSINSFQHPMPLSLRKT
jgi:hypothetical protein